HRLEPLGEDDLVSLMRRAMDDPERGLGNAAPGMNADQLLLLARQANGDARAALNLLETVAAAMPGAEVTGEDLRRILQRRNLYYDKSGEEHFNLISALHKSVRSSQADAAVYWLTRMME